MDKISKLITTIDELLSRLEREKAARVRAEELLQQYKEASTIWFKRYREEREKRFAASCKS